ncbi:hypothetical protein ACWF5S_21950 [Peribacillus butanolivorans]
MTAISALTTIVKILSLESREFTEYGTRDRESFYLVLIHTVLIIVAYINGYT